MTAVRLDGVTVGYGTGPVLRQVSMAVRPGRMAAVEGPSGAGKTTLLWTAAGLLRPDAGTVTFDGAPGPDRSGRGPRVVLVPQGNGLAPVLTAAENLLVTLVAGGDAAGPARQATAHALALLGLSGQADQLVEELSGGQQQRTAVARGLAMRGDVLLADEVTSELDAGNRRRVLELLRAQAERGASVLLATHDPEAVAACDTSYRLVDGLLREQ